MEDAVADSVYSIEVVRKLFESTGKVVARVVWDRDDDILADITQALDVATGTAKAAE